MGFFTFLKLCKCYQIAQNVPNVCVLRKKLPMRIFLTFLYLRRGSSMNSYKFPPVRTSFRPSLWTLLCDQFFRKLLTKSVRSGLSRSLFEKSALKTQNEFTIEFFLIFLKFCHNVLLEAT